MDQNQKIRETRIQIVHFGHWTRRHFGFREIYVPGVGPFVPTVSIGRLDGTPFAGSYNETVRNSQTGM